MCRILSGMILLVLLIPASLSALDSFDRNIHLYRKIAQYKESLRQRPDDPDTLRNLAVTYGQVQLYAQAEDVCRRLIVLDPRSGKYRYNLAWTWHKLGRLEEAVREYGEALKRDPALESAWYNRAVAQVGLKRFAEAVATAEAGQKHHPDSAKLELVRGEALKEMGRLKDALASAVRVTEWFPQGFDGWYLRAAVLARLGKQDEALAALARAREIDARGLEYARDDEDFAGLRDLLK